MRKTGNKYFLFSQKTSMATFFSNDNYNWFDLDNRFQPLAQPILLVSQKTVNLQLYRLSKISLQSGRLTNFMFLPPANSRDQLCDYERLSNMILPIFLTFQVIVSFTIFWVSASILLLQISEKLEFGYPSPSI